MKPADREQFQARIAAANSARWRQLGFGALLRGAAKRKAKQRQAEAAARAAGPTPCLPRPVPWAATG